LCKSRRTCFKFYCMFCFTCDRCLRTETETGPIASYSQCVDRTWTVTDQERITAINQPIRELECNRSRLTGWSVVSTGTAWKPGSLAGPPARKHWLAFGLAVTRWSRSTGYSTPGPVNTGMGDCLQSRLKPNKALDENSTSSYRASPVV